MKALTAVLGDKRYDPRDTGVLARWIRLTTAANPDAVIVDFFGGSGSTAQAVMEMNEADGGQRQAVVITNNELDEDQAKRLAKEGLSPGEPDWERWGVFEHVARPRLSTVVSGIRPDGSVYSDGMSQNVHFLELTYRDHQLVELDMDFDAIAPLLWMRAGSRGPIITESFDGDGRRRPYVWTDRYAVLFKPSAGRTLIAEMPDTVATVFVVSDNPSEFARIAAEAPDGVELVRLYDSYLTALTGSKDKI